MTAALEGGEWSAAHPGRTLPRERPGTHFTGGKEGMNILQTLERKKGQQDLSHLALELPSKARY